ncbi:hypothetical protein ALC62_13427 [Cyphomyrmex costatus]|uniref:Uncharacterized protein n=1 Tax=Cyphomyrmex costatus TaxID=456900 RepID=A0A195C532_9HYME|nr:hypothetical protein ALC62_13427 [Cyphomyrmex costatus]
MKAIKERSATNFQASALYDLILTVNIEAKEELLIATDYATHFHLIIILFRNKSAPPLYLCQLQ